MPKYESDPVHLMNIPSPHDPNQTIVMRLQKRWNDTTEWVNAQAYNPHIGDWHDFDFTMTEVAQIMEGNHAPIINKFDQADQDPE